MGRKSVCIIFRRAAPHRRVAWKRNECFKSNKKRIFSSNSITNYLYKHRKVESQTLEDIKSSLCSSNAFNPAKQEEMLKEHQKQEVEIKPRESTISEQEVEINQERVLFQKQEVEIQSEKRFYFSKSNASRCENF